MANASTSDSSQINKSQVPECRLPLHNTERDSFPSCTCYMTNDIGNVDLNMVQTSSFENETRKSILNEETDNENLSNVGQKYFQRGCQVVDIDELVDTFEASTSFIVERGYDLKKTNKVDKRRVRINPNATILGEVNANGRHPSQQSRYTRVFILIFAIIVIIIIYILALTPLFN